ncbi:putative DD34D transposase [Trichonephila clavipes]|uniref:Putative DD34D transposase n=1 Tax=Trichonephila clavipes TaxID=2585209 RepID=A0A8X6VVG5_TRICX|nr:putative DD34D transposase [Trichonephila clavipes]
MDFRFDFTDQEKTCPPGEEWSECYAGCQHNCSNVGQVIICPRMCIPGCICDDPGTVRGPDGNCIAPPLCSASPRDILHDKDAFRTGRPVVKNVNKITEIIELDWHRGEAAQTVAKPGLTTRKVLPCVWWDWKRIIFYELLPYGQTLNSDLYFQQLDSLKLAIDQKRPELASSRGEDFLQDNARPHTSVMIRQKLWELGWEVLR